MNAYELSTPQIELIAAQRGFVRRPGCFENVCKVRALIKVAREENRSIAVGAIDLAKAFDSVQQSSVQRALNHFGTSDHLFHIVEDHY
ncbi:hypothetical protein QYM36_000889 [Artemia franciscana]|uniref:Reverse transcriptase domain-containing protein n=1 Tax=Artemia franciscana TaxID=6661 RepID=A0AA88I500_ARTSF|nr:hypothetical protein QYM36_000889 [Artemia franciscana]